METKILNLINSYGGGLYFNRDGYANLSREI